MANWVDILANADWPTDVVVLDFECYFDADYHMGRDAAALSTVEYITDERFEDLGLGCVRVRANRAGMPPVPDFDHNSGEVLTWLQGQYGANLEGCTVVAQNAAFDGGILAWRHKIVPPYVVDVLGLARHIDPGLRNDLASLCKRYGLTDKGDTSQFKGFGLRQRLGPPTLDRFEFSKKKRKKPKTPRLYHTGDLESGGLYQDILRQGMTPDMRQALADYCKNDVLQEWNLFKLLLPVLSNPTTELRLMRHTLGLFWEPCIGVDFEAGTQLVADMTAKVAGVAEEVGLSPVELRKAAFPALDEALGDESIPMKQGKNGPIPALAKDDEGLAMLKEHPNPRVRALVLARQAVKSWPLHIARVERIMAQAKAAGGLLPVPLKYCGAHTGRWSGGERINLQNLTHRSIEELINRIRGLLVAVFGQALVIADASQIEARVLDFLAGQSDMVEAWRSNAPIYCQFASAVLGVPVDKSMKNERSLGKVGVLGCGFGMGVDRCLDYAENVYHVEGMTRELAAQVVNHYRDTHTAVCRFWRDVEHAFKFVTKYPHETRRLDRGLTFWRDEESTCIGLPSGRVLRYAGAVVTGTGRDEELGWPDSQKPGSWTRAWGGFLVENIVQAVSRDILGEAVLLFEDWSRVEDLGYRIGHHVHDELIGVGPKENSERALQLEIAALSTNPAWLPGCPLAAEGTIAERYGK